MPSRRRKKPLYGESRQDMFWVIALCFFMNLPLQYLVSFFLFSMNNQRALRRDSVLSNAKKVVKDAIYFPNWFG